MIVHPKEQPNPTWSVLLGIGFETEVLSTVVVRGVERQGPTAYYIKKIKI